MNTLLTTNGAIHMIKEVIEISHNVMQDQLLDNTSERGTLGENLMGSGRTSEEKQGVTGHVEVKAKSFKCPKCILLFGSQKLVQFHVRKKHSGAYRRLETCPICSRTCKYKSVLSIHMNNHREKICPICNLVVSDTEALKKHVESLHIGKLDFVCPICFKLSIDTSRHDDHVSSHNSRRRYECVDCLKYYASLEGLERHRQTHAGFIQNKYQDQYDCSIYSKSYASGRSLRGRLKCHSGTDRYKCYQCPKYFFRRQALQNHRKTHSCLSRKSIPFKRNEYPKDSTSRQTPLKRQTHLRKIKFLFKCSICCQSLSNSQTLRFHMNLHNDTQPYKCDECPNTYASPQALQKHRKKHMSLPRKITVRKYNCSYCLKSYHRKEYLSYHINTHTGARPFKCDQCPRDYASPKALSTHRKSHMPGIKCRVKCSVCSKYLSDSKSLRFHMNTHSGSRPYRCDQCPKSFASPSNLIQHRNRHAKRAKSEYKCYVCTDVFSELRSRNLHMNSHNDAPFECLRCEKVYTSRRSLSHHYRHNPSHGGYEHKCSICSKGFFFKQRLNHHMKTHFEAPLYKCDECPKEFHSTSSLSQHRRIHLTDGKNIHKCQVCYETFNVQRALDAHMTVHDGLRPYKCDQCPKDYGSRRALKAHQKKHLIKSSEIKADRHDKSLQDEGRNGELDKITDIHTALAKFRCKECNKEFICERNLSFHLRQHAK